MIDLCFLSLVAGPLLLAAAAAAALVRAGEPTRCPACGSRDTLPADLADEWSGMSGRACTACGHHWPTN